MESFTELYHQLEIQDFIISIITLWSLECNSSYAEVFELKVHFTCPTKLDTDWQFRSRKTTVYSFLQNNRDWRHREVIAIWKSNCVRMYSSCYSCCHSVAKLCLTLWLHGLQHARLLSPPLSLRVCSNSCSQNQWCSHPLLSSFSFCLQSLSALGSFPMSWLFASGGESVGALAPVSVLPMNIQGWFPLGLIGLISLQSKGFSRVFSSSTIWKHQFFGT